MARVPAVEPAAPVRHSGSAGCCAAGWPVARCGRCGRWPPKIVASARQTCVLRRPTGCGCPAAALAASTSDGRSKAAHGPGRWPAPPAIRARCRASRAVSDRRRRSAAAAPRRTGAGRTAAPPQPTSAANRRTGFAGSFRHRRHGPAHPGTGSIARSWLGQPDGQWYCRRV